MERTSGRRLLSLVGLAFALALGQPAAQARTVVYVDADAPAGGNGSSWPMAYRFLQDGLAFASNPVNGVTEIRVARGAYRPDRSETNPSGTGNRAASFLLISGVALRGGYVGLPDPGARDVKSYETVLTGDLAGDDEPRFLNYDENSYHVVIGSGEDLTAVLDGFTITAANADGSGFDARGGGFFAANGGATIANCVFIANFARVGGGVEIRASSNISLIGCDFLENSTECCAGALYLGDFCTAVLVDCRFVGNDGGFGPGAVDIFTTASALLLNCEFVRNFARGPLAIGGAILDTGGATMINCTFSQNTADLGGGVYSASEATFVNCTFSNNVGHGLVVDANYGPATLTNCILWGNTPEQILSFPKGPLDPLVSHSDVQGGWPGPSNIDADPLFVQPISDDVRLTFGSPCVDAGSNAALPPDTLDLDGDGNTTEPIPFDLAGNPRVLGGIVDMGAYEGEYEPLPPMAEETDWDTGETAILIPTGGAFNPMGAAVVIASNVIGANNATVMLTEWSGSSYPGAGGYSELAVMLDFETTLQDGQHFERVFVPFDAGDLGGADPLQANLTYFDVAVGNWGLAVAGNMGHSPGFNGPIGDRIVAVGSGPPEWGLSDQLGDYGVFWSPGEQKGFAWGNVDHAAQFAVGVSLCPADCRQTPDGVVNVLDLLTMLLSFGPVGGGAPCDLNGDGIVDLLDLIELLAVFGTACP